MNERRKQHLATFFFSHAENRPIVDLPAVRDARLAPRRRCPRSPLPAPERDLGIQVTISGGEISGNTFVNSGQPRALMGQAKAQDDAKPVQLKQCADIIVKDNRP